MSGSASWHPASTPYRLTSIAERIACSDWSRNGPIGITPALLISTSMWPPPSVRALSRNVANDSAVGDVERVARDRAQLGQVRDGRLLQRNVTVADDHAGAAGQQGLGGGVADAPGGAGDRDGLAPDVVHAAKLYMSSLVAEVPWAGGLHARCTRLSIDFRKAAATTPATAAPGTTRPSTTPGTTMIASFRSTARRTRSANLSGAIGRSRSAGLEDAPRC